MNVWILKELRAQVLFDLREFVPKGYFVRENPLIINGVDTSHDEKWGYLALALGEKLLYESQAYLLTASARQTAAIELLISLGMLASFEITHPERPKAINDMQVSLKKYRDYLTEQEAKPFIFLLKSEPKQSEPQASATATQTNRGINKRKVAATFQGIKWDYAHWLTNLATPSNKMWNCCVSKGSKSSSALWNPVSIGLYLLDEEIPIKKLDSIFLGLKDWIDEWNEKTELERD